MPRCALLVLTCLASGCILWARAPEAFAHPQFYAEDLGVFWQQWRTLDLASLWTPYSGYMHLAPRLGAASASLLPHSLQPAGYLAAAVLITAWTAATIASAHLPRLLGPALALSALLVPHDGEIWASLVNVQWLMACALPVIAMTAAPCSAGVRFNQLAFLTVAGLTGPFSALMLPLWLLRAVRAAKQGERHGWWVAAIGTTAGLIQLVLLATAQAPIETPGQPRPIAMAAAFAERFGLDYLSALGAPIGVALLLYLLLAPRVPEGRGLRGAFTVFALVVMIPTFAKFYRMPELMISRDVAGRYFYLPSVMLMWMALSLTWARRPLPTAIGALSAALIMLPAVRHLARQPRPFYPDWQQSSDQIGRQPVTVKYAPDWHITIPATPR